VVEALDGRPGIFSARYAGDHDFEKNIAKVLAEMQGIENRKAYFITVLCWYDHRGAQFYEGRVEGNLLFENKGHQGFGYDPIFVPNGYVKTFAEMQPEEKNKISHRKNAFDKLLKVI
jgi:XTP/dITP diphosphohydrolase